MPDLDFDAVVVGGGHHGTIIACYLAGAGLEVGLFERSPTLGGGATSGAGPAPGFTMNYCSHWTRFYGHPAYRDFNLRQEGLRYTFPDENEGMVFDDGTSFIGYSAFRVVDPLTGAQERSESNIRRTHEQIARFSPRDAETYLDVLEKYTRYWKAAFGRHRFTPPPPWGQPDPLEELLAVPDSGIEPVHQFMTVRQLAYDFFESDELRTLFMRAAATSTGCFPDDQMGLQGLLHVLPLTLSIEAAAIAVGGSQAISDALVSAGRRLGARYFTRCEVDRVVVEAGRAAGIQLTDGSVARARVVVSGLGVTQTVLRLLRDQPVAPRILHRLRNVHYDRGQLFWANVAVHELPRYSAAAANPGLGPQPRLYWGPKDPDYLALRYQPEIFLNGFASRPYVLCSADTIWDPSRAPEGKHLIGVEEFAAPFRMFSKRRWREIREEFGHHLLREWRRYAPNMTDENVVSVRVYGPDNILVMHPDMVEGGYSEGSTISSQMGRFRPTPELSGYRMLLPNLYNCSSNMHSGSGIGRGSSYNCFQLMAADMGLPSGAAND